MRGPDLFLVKLLQLPELILVIDLMCFKIFFSSSLLVIELECSLISLVRIFDIEEIK
jgi:hypothetical protein